MLAGLLFSGVSLFDTYTLKQESEALRSESALTRLRYNDIVKTFPAIPTDNETLRRVIDRYAELEKSDATPTGLYYEISRALVASPAVELDSIDWNVGGFQPVSGQNVSANAVNKDSETAMVRGTLKLAANANARQMLAAFNVLVESLKTNSKLQVDVLQRPFDIESGKALKGGDTTLEDNKPRSFALQISRKLGS